MVLKRFSPKSWIRENRPDVLCYVAMAGDEKLELYWDNQAGVQPGWVVRVYPATKRSGIWPYCESTVEGRKGSKIETLHKNVRRAFA